VKYKSTDWVWLQAVPADSMPTFKWCRYKIKSMPLEQLARAMESHTKALSFQTGLNLQAVLLSVLESDLSNLRGVERLRRATTTMTLEAKVYFCQQCSANSVLRARI
jgi:hypothetical protein